MICHERKIIFVHVPKCAGTSIENVLWSKDQHNEVHWFGGDSRGRCAYQTGGLQHLKAWRMRHILGAERYEQYFKFAIVRNPFDRAVSQYQYHMRRPDLLTLLELNEGASFQVYLRALRAVAHIQWEPQISFINDFQGNQLVDFIGRYEKLDQDWHEICTKIGLAYAPLPRLNSSHTPSDHGEYFTAETRELVEAIYADDITYLSYEFTLGADKLSSG